MKVIASADRQPLAESVLDMKRSLSLLPLMLLSFAITGCNDGRFTFAPVSGTVTVDGEPLDRAYVSYDPIATAEDGIAGPSSYGRTDSEGRYTLKTTGDHQGAVVATHRVSIRSRLTEARGEDEDSVVIIRKEILPEHYHRSTELRMEVPIDGTDQANFELETGKRR